MLVNGPMLRRSFFQLILPARGSYGLFTWRQMYICKYINISKWTNALIILLADFASQGVHMAWIDGAKYTFASIKIAP